VLIPNTDGFVYAFKAMASPCEIRMETPNASLAEELGRMAEAEARRIECKYSRYRPDSFLSQINGSGGSTIKVDDETAEMLDLAARCFELSDGMFDVTSGILRRVWRFDGSDRVPSQRQIDEILPLVGWHNVRWERPWLTMPKGMEIDFGGIGKEYAVDSVLIQLFAQSRVPILVNFGGDLRVSGPKANGERWPVVIESVDQDALQAFLEIASGALTTSGDARRSLVKDGVRYGHILDPRTGWPVVDPPRSVTVAADTCLEAGMMSTLAMLHGKRAEAFLRDEGLQAWWIR
jgi:thiamine biosynthesis lipoprotein